MSKPIIKPKSISKPIIRPGDVVATKSYGVRMTVETCTEDYAHTVWFDDDQHLQRGTFRFVVLRVVKE